MFIWTISVATPTAIPMQSEMKLKIGFKIFSQPSHAEPNDVAMPIAGLFESVSIIIC